MLVPRKNQAVGFEELRHIEATEQALPGVTVNPQANAANTNDRAVSSYCEFQFVCQTWDCFLKQSSETIILHQV